MERRSQNGIVAPSHCAIAGRRYGVGGAIRAIAGRQHGLITRPQLLALGMSANGIDSRVKRRSLLAIHRGVYLTGAVMPPRVQEMAAVLACREPAYASHGSAVGLHGLLPSRWDSTPVNVTLVGRAVRRPGVVGHCVVAIGADEVDRVDGVPVTTACRAILDLAATAPQANLEHLLAQAYAKRLTSRDRLLRLLDRYPGRPGSAILRELLDAPNAPARTRSPPERRLLALLRKAKVPQFDANARLHGWEVDFLWRDRGLVVELDALSTHTSPRDFERDRRKDADLTLRGHTVIRVTRRQLDREPEAVIARIAMALALRD